jgi:lipoprotein-anchoring transpeptidase ErfK/SrfK
MGRSRVALSGLLVAFAVSATPAAAQFFGFPAAPQPVYQNHGSYRTAYTPQYQNQGYGYGYQEYQEPQDAFRPQATPIPRQVVEYNGRHAPGTIVVSTEERRLYYVLGNGKAIAYGVGVGRPGFEWSGTKSVTMKREWPDWRPPAEMLKRRPDLPRHMAGGPDNPLGARAMYLGNTLYRIHGSNEPETIGQAVSSGCIRMTNEDVVDLYSRVKVGTKVVVL